MGISGRIPGIVLIFALCLTFALVNASAAHVIIPWIGMGGHSKLECSDCHTELPYHKINVSSIEICEKCHEKEVKEVMKSKHAGLGATRPDTMPNTCLVCHNPHLGVVKENGIFENQTVAEYNKFAFKLKKVGILETEHTWRTFGSIREFCLDCHGRGDHGKNVSDPSKVTGREGVWFQHDWYGNDRPIPKIEGLGDERGALPMDDPDFISYNVWKMEKKHYGFGNAPYGSANYTEGLKNCSHACHYGGSLIVMGGKKVPPSGYECSDCHLESHTAKKKIEMGVHATYLSQDCTKCHVPHTFKALKAKGVPAGVTPTTATPTATPAAPAPGFELLTAVICLIFAYAIARRRI